MWIVDFTEQKVTLGRMRLTWYSHTYRLKFWALIIHIKFLEFLNELNLEYSTIELICIFRLNSLVADIFFSIKTRFPNQKIMFFQQNVQKNSFSIKKASAKYFFPFLKCTVFPLKWSFLHFIVCTIHTHRNPFFSV